MKRQTLIGLTLGIAVSAAAALLLNTSPLYGQDRDQAERDRQRQLEQRQQLLQQRQQQQVQAEVNPAGNPVILDIPANPVTGPNPHEARHYFEIDGITPDWTTMNARVLSPITASIQSAGVTTPHHRRVQIMLGRTQVHTLTIGGPLPHLHAFSDWFKNFSDGIEDKRSMTVVQLGRDGREELQRTILYECAPIEFTVDITTNSWRMVIASEHVEFTQD